MTDAQARSPGPSPGSPRMSDRDLASRVHLLNRRRFLYRTSGGLGVAALASLLGEQAAGTTGKTHLAPKVKNVIYLFMAGGPAHVDLFDPKPKLQAMHGQEMPKSVLGEQRVTLMTRN